MTKQESEDLKELIESNNRLAQSLREHKLQTEETLKSFAQQIKNQPLSIENDFNIVVSQAIAVALKSNLEGYNSPLKPILEKAVERNKSKIEDAFNQALDSLSQTDLVDAVKNRVVSDFVKQCVNASGGMVDKYFNALKQDAAFRAKLTVALDKVVSDLIKDI
jgi:hypothetical protein